jgi:hypothetical protein
VSEFNPTTIYEAFISLLNHVMFSIGSNEVLFRDYAGRVFDKIRKMQITTTEYLSSWSLSSAAMLPSSGKSNARFFFSHDKRFLLKTLSIGEVRALLKILPVYFQVSTKFD